MQKELINIVWFKRDLRLTDNAPLAWVASQSIPCILIYCFEPKLMQSPDCDIRHLRFVWESLVDMHKQLSPKHSLTVAVANAEDVLEKIFLNYEVRNLCSHEETGNAISFERDKRIKKLCAKSGVKWKEFPTNGIIRGLANRADWNASWLQTMESAQQNVCWDSLVTVAPQLPENWTTKQLDANIKIPNNSFQQGGEKLAKELLNSFVNGRVSGYMKDISRPLESRTGCSRLSPYLAFGNISIRQVYQASLHQAQMGRYQKPLQFFVSRLHWHCHFIQKFEQECSIEFNNLNKAFDAIRNEKNELLYNAWAEGKTGFPIVDACMECLKQTGYINFRMRAMLVSFLTHNLWQHWKTGAHHLARYFLDYEPGIHYPQLQMQAGTMGVNTIRTYNPSKQSLDHDEQGVFIKRWLPSLKNVDAPLVHQPWLMTKDEQQKYNCIIGIDYPKPIIDLSETSKRANKLLWETKRLDEAKLENKRILQKHSMRKTESENPMASAKSKLSRKPDLNYKLF